MPGETRKPTPDGNGTAERLDKVIGLLEEQNRLLVTAGEKIAPHLPLLDKAAAMLASPAARIATMLPGGRRPR